MYEWRGHVLRKAVEILWVVIQKLQGAVAEDLRKLGKYSGVLEDEFLKKRVGVA